MVLPRKSGGKNKVGILKFINHNKEFEYVGESSKTGAASV